MNYGEFKKYIANKEIYGPYLFHGEEGLIADEIIEYIKNNFVNREFLELNFTSLQGENVNLDQFYSAIETLPFLSDYRLIVIYGAGDFYKNKDLTEIFYNSLDNIGKGTILIFEDMDGNLKKNTKLYKYFKSNKRNIDFNKLSSKELRDYIKKQLSLANKTMSDGDISYFILQTGYENKKLQVNLYELKSELDKVIAYASTDLITKKDIDQSVEKVNDSNIFNLLNAIQEKNPSKGLAYLHDLYEKNEPVGVIIHMIQRRYRHLYAYVGLSEDGYNPGQIQKQLNISNYEFKNVAIAGNSYNLCDIQKDLNYIYETDKNLKSSPINELTLLEYLIVNLCK